MTEYLNKSFSVYAGTGDKYRSNWDAIFNKQPAEMEKETAQPVKEEPKCGGFEPVPDHLKDPFVRPMRIMVDGLVPNGVEPNNHPVYTTGNLAIKKEESLLCTCSTDCEGVCPACRPTPVP